MGSQTNPQIEDDLKSVKLPYLSGILLRLFVALLENPLRGLIIPKLLRDSGIAWFREQPIDAPHTLHPITVLDKGKCGEI